MTSRSALLTTFLAVAVASAFACTSEAPAPTPTPASPVVDLGTAQAGAPKIGAEESVFDFGSVRPKESVEHVFTVRNEGDADLHIDRVQKT